MNSEPHTMALRHSQSKAEDRERLETMYIRRMITREEFFSWLELGGHTTDQKKIKNSS